MAIKKRSYFWVFSLLSALYVTVFTNSIYEAYKADDTTYKSHLSKGIGNWGQDMVDLAQGRKSAEYVREKKIKAEKEAALKAGYIYKYLQVTFWSYYGDDWKTALSLWKTAGKEIHLSGPLAAEGQSILRVQREFTLQPFPFFILSVAVFAVGIWILVVSCSYAFIKIRHNDSINFHQASKRLFMVLSFALCIVALNYVAIGVEYARKEIEGDKTPQIQQKTVRE